MNRPYIISIVDSKYLHYFEYLVMTIALWNAIWTPLTISIDGARDLDATIGFFLINTFVDFIFWVDIIV